MNIDRALRHSGIAALAAVALSSLAVPATAANSILFVGNSFTYGEPAGGAPTVQNYRPNTVTDLNNSGIGGVPALFKGLTTQAGLDYNVSLETVPGVGVDYHYNNKLPTILRPYDTVVLQSYSTLDATRPGNPATLIQYSGLLAQAFHNQNPNVDIRLDSTWSRADQTYLRTGAWYGQPITQMALDVRKGYDAADAASNFINGVIPVGQAWNRALLGGLADVNPYDGISPGQIDLWAPDNYHASIYGYYLEALTLFGGITGLDPRSLGSNEFVARDIGIAPSIAASLQQIAFDHLASEAVPEPGMLAMFVTAGGLMFCVRKRRKNRG